MGKQIDTISLDLPLVIIDQVSPICFSFISCHQIAESRENLNFVAQKLSGDSFTNAVLSLKGIHLIEFSVLIYAINQISTVYNLVKTSG